MKDLAVVEESKDFLKKLVYNIGYGIKFKKLNIDKSFSETLIYRSDGADEKAIFQLIRKSKNQENFENNVKDYFKSTERNI